MKVATRFLPGMITTPKQEKQLPVKRQITVKSTLKRTQKTLLSITAHLAFHLIFKNLWQKMLDRKPATLFLSHATINIHFIILIKVKT